MALHKRICATTKNVFLQIKRNKRWGLTFKAYSCIIIYEIYSFLGKKIKSMSRKKPGGNCQLLDSFMKEKGLTQRALAKKSGIPTWVLYRMRYAIKPPGEDEIQKLKNSGMPEDQLESWVESTRGAYQRSVRANNGDIAPRAHSEGGVVSTKGLETLTEIMSEYGKPIPTNLAMIIMKHLSS